MKIRLLFISVFFTLGLYSYSRAPMLDFITGDAFRSLCHYIYEQQGDYGENSGLSLDSGIFNNSPGDLVFVQPYLLDDFIKNIHPNIPNPYFLITHNSDNIIDSRYLSLLHDPKIIKWFGQNIDLDDEKIVPVPIGIEDRYYYFKRTSDMYLLKRLARKKISRNNYTYLNIRPVTFKTERQFVLDFFKGKSFIKRIENRNYNQYLRDLKEHRFCISPSGNGLDCHRTWEALYMGCIPIVRPFVSDTLKLAEGNASMYEDLPVIVIKEWEEITPMFLHEKLQEIYRTKYNYDKLFFPYWRKLIEKEVREYMNSLH